MAPRPNAQKRVAIPIELQWNVPWHLDCFQGIVDFAKEHHWEYVVDPYLNGAIGDGDLTGYDGVVGRINNMNAKRVLDMGCGTGILAILCKMKEAGHTVGIDIDDWSMENSVENARRNNVELETRLGGKEQLGGDTFDIILANINLNVLLADMAAYSAALVDGGTIIFSGFYEDDLQTLEASAHSHGLTLQGHTVRDTWTSAVFNKT